VHASIAEANLHALVAGRLVGIPVLIAEETGMPRHGRVARLTYRAVYRFAAAIVGVTNAVCDYVREVDRAPRDRVRRIYNCASPRYFSEPRHSVAREATGMLEVLLVGRLVPVKGHLFLLHVLRQVLPQHPRVRVRIAGEGPLREQLQTTIDAYGLSSQVELLGLRSDVDALLRSTHVFALPSTSEGCSVSLIEAMALGVQVIGSDVPGIREVMGALSDEWTAAPNAEDAWLELLNRTFSLTSTERERLAEQAQQRAYANFSPAVYVRSLELLYGELAKRQ
jgi:glycosyltransferase involved in cell wall biosynthesis